MTKFSVTRVFALALGLMALSGCAGVLMGGAATGAVVVHDPRTTGSVIEDQAIEIKAHDALDADGQLAEQAHISVTSYNQMVLLTGQAPTPELKTRAAEIVSRVAKVKHVYDEVVVGSPVTAVIRTNDGLLTTKVKTKLLSIKDLDSTRIKVVTEDGVVYLMGLLDKPTGDAVAEVVSGVSGVRKVVKLFEYQS